jgi:20S proteasome alpha/beta subunit
MRPLAWLLIGLSLLPMVDSAGAAVPLETPLGKQWEPSWIASSARGTSIAVSCRVDLAQEADSKYGPSNKNNNGIVLVMKTSAPATITSTLQYTPTEGNEMWTDLTTTTASNFSDIPPIRIQELSMDQQIHAKTPSSSSFWTPLGTHAICSMTGLSYDVNHVCRVIQKTIDTQRTNDYETPLMASFLAQSLARTVRQVTTFRYGRPYGLQALLVGKQQQQQQQQQGQQLQVYTVDPSGAWRCWGSGCTAIGRTAETVRRHLYEGLVATTSTPTKLHPQVALEVALKACLEASQAASSNQDNDLYDAVLFWVDEANGQCHVGKVDHDAVTACRDRIARTLEIAV